MRITAAAAAVLLAACQSAPPPPVASPAPCFDRAVAARLASAPRTATTPAEGDLRAFGSVGLTADPSTFLLGGGADYYLGPDWALGGLLQVGFDSNDTIVATSSQFKRLFALGSKSEPSRWRPYVEAGLGLCYMRRANRLADKDGFGVLLNAGGGVQLRVGDGVDVSSGVLFNLVPGEVAGESFFFTWQVVQMGFWF